MGKELVYCRYTDGVFTPKEVEAITGVSTVTQRAWKARGLLMEPRAGRASFSAHELVNFMALQIASQNLRVELSFVHEAIAQAVPSILWWALNYEKAWDVEGSPEQKALFKRALDSTDKENLVSLDLALGVRRERFGRFLMRYAGEWQLVFDLADIFDPEEIAAVVVLDLFAVGNALVESPKRPRGLMIASDIGSRAPPLRAPIEKRARRK